MKLAVAGAVAFGAFAISGPLEHFGVLPQTAVGDASKGMIKAALNMSSKPALAQCGPQGNNGFGNNGGDGVPGNSGFPDDNR
jgi:hypothetical protein